MRRFKFGCGELEEARGALVAQAHRFNAICMEHPPLAICKRECVGLLPKFRSSDTNSSLRTRGKSWWQKEAPYIIVLTVTRSAHPYVWTKRSMHA